MYAEALHENERLKSRLQDSKQELAKIRSQLEKVTQVEKTEHLNPKQLLPLRIEIIQKDVILLS